MSKNRDISFLTVTDIRCTNYLKIEFMLPILVVMKSLALTLILKLRLCGSNIFQRNAYCHLVVR